MAKKSEDWGEALLNKASNVAADAKLEGLVDGGLKLASTAATIVATKVVIDIVADDEALMNWIEKYGRAMDSLMSSVGPTLYLMGNVGPIAALAKTVWDDEQVKQDVWDSFVAYGRGFTVGLGQMGIEAAYKLISPMLQHDEDIKTAVQGVVSERDSLAAEQAFLRDRLVELTTDKGRGTSVQELYEALQALLKESVDETSEGLLQRISAARVAYEAALNEQSTKEARLRVVSARLLEILNAEEVYRRGKARMLQLTRWAMAFVVGILVSTTMIYAGDSIYDLIGGALSSIFSFPLPMKV